MQNVNFAVDNFLTLQSPQTQTQTAFVEKQNYTSGQSFLDLVKGSVPSDSDNFQTADTGNFQKETLAKAENKDIESSAPSVKSEKTEEDQTKLAVSEKSEEKKDSVTENSVSDNEKLENSEKNEVIAEEISDNTQNEDNKVLNARYSMLNQLLGTNKKEAANETEKSIEKMAVSEQLEDAEIKNTIDSNLISMANIQDFEALNNADNTGLEKFVKNASSEDKTELVESLDLDTRHIISETDKRNEKDEMQHKILKFGEKISFDITDLRTKPAEVDQDVSKVKVDSPKANFKTDIAYSGDNNIQFTFSMNKEIADADILSSNALAASAAGSNFQAMLENLIESNAQDFARAGSIVLRDNNVGNISLILHPDSLGNVKINLELSDKIVTGHITVASKEAMQAFEGNLTNLKNAFTQSGFENASFDLSMSGQNAGGFGNGTHSDSRNMQQMSDKLYGDYTVSSSAAAMENESVFSGYRSDYSVDIVA